jgi:hypothetical protein
MEKNKFDGIMHLYDGHRLLSTLCMECARKLVIILHV